LIEFTEEFKEFNLDDSSWKILNKIFDKPHLINVFQMNSDSSEDIELAILKAFLACIFINRNIIRKERISLN
jgi:hypothetical protein